MDHQHLITSRIISQMESLFELAPVAKTGLSTLSIFKDEFKARKISELNPLLTVSTKIYSKQPAAEENLLCNSIILMHFNEELITSAPETHYLQSHLCC